MGKYAYFLPIGEKYTFSPLFSSPYNHFFLTFYLAIILHNPPAPHSWFIYFSISHMTFLHSMVRATGESSRLFFYYMNFQTIWGKICILFTNWGKLCIFPPFFIPFQSFSFLNILFGHNFARRKVKHPTSPITLNMNISCVPQKCIICSYIGHIFLFFFVNHFTICEGI